MRLTVKILGVQTLVEAMGDDGEAEVDFAGGSVQDLFHLLLEELGFQWDDHPVLKDWEENLPIAILHNGAILSKENYGHTALQEGDRISFMLYTGCC